MLKSLTPETSVGKTSSTNHLGTVFSIFGVCFDTSHWFGGSGSDLWISIFNMKWGTKELRVSQPAWQLKKCKWYISWGYLMWYFMRYNQQWAFSPWELIWPPKWGYTFLMNDGWLQRLMATSWFYFLGRANEAIQEFSPPSYGNSSGENDDSRLV